MAIRVYQVNDCDWWVGESAESILEAYMKDTGLPREEVCDDPDGMPEEISEEGLDKLKFFDEESRPPVTRTFREQLAIEIADGGEFPRAFASTEY